MGRGAPVVVGSDSGNPRRERKAKCAKQAASTKSPSWPIASTGSTGAPSRRASRAISVAFRLPPPQTSQRRGASRHLRQGRRRRLDGEGGERRRAVGVGEAFRASRQPMEMVAVERFRRRAAEIGVPHPGGDQILVDAAARGQRAVLVMREP